MKNQIKLIGCLVIFALVLSFLTFPTHAEKTASKGLATAVTPQSLDARVGAQDGPPVEGQLIQGRRNDPELSRHFRNYDLIRINPDLAAASVKNNGRLSLKTSRRDFDMKFVSYDMRSPDYTAQEIGADGVAHKLPKTAVTTFKGNVKGDPRAQARLTVTSKGVEGAIITDENQFYIQPASALSKNARGDEFVFYSADDVAATDATCGVTLAEEVAAREELTREQQKGEITSEFNSPITTLSPMKVVRIATEADAEYVTAAGGATAANNQIQQIMSMVDAIYQLEMGVHFEIGFQNTWTDQATDPYTTTVPGSLLTEFRNYWNANFPVSNPTFSRQLAHLWTGKDLDSTTIGIASLGVVCRFPNSAYGLSQRFPMSGVVDARTAILTAHEIGHNFSAQHTNQATTETPPDFEKSCDNSIMEAGLGSATNSSFCVWSRSQIVGFANGQGSCLTAGNPPPTNSCNEVPIDGTLTANGTLSNTDCRSTQRGADFFADQYSFNGVAGQRVAISMTHPNGVATLDPYLILIGPDGFPVSQDDDGSPNGNNDSQIPSGFATIALPYTGKYVIEATSFFGQMTGDYTVTVTPSGCTLSATPSQSHFPSSGGSGTLNVTANGTNCGPSYMFMTSPNTASWLQPQITGGSGSQNLAFNVQANPNTAGRRAFLVLGPSPTDFSGGMLFEISQSGTGPDCSVTPIGFGQTINGTLALSDCESPIRGDGYHADRYSFTASAGQQVAITVNARGSSNPLQDTFVNLIGPNGVVLLNDDDSGGGTNSRIPGGTGNFPIGVAGTYTIEVTGFSGAPGPPPPDLGDYSLTLTGTGASTPAFQFSQPTYSVSEGSTNVTVTVTRSGDTSGTATVDYTTTDTDNFTVNCATFTGNAFARCDFSTTLDTLTFAPGDTSKSFVIPIIDDSWAEGNETFGVALSNPTGGAILGSPSTATVTITDNETVNGPNPIFTTPFFVRQHYLDFLSREPEAGEPWSGVLNGCSDVNNDPSCDRLTVSGAIFGSQEFQLKGYYNYRFYKLAFNRLPLYEEIVVDMRKVTGTTQQDTFNRKAEFANNFVLRTVFANQYNGLSNTQYVNTLMSRYSLSAITTTDPNNPDTGAQVTLTTQDLIDRLNGVGGTLTRAQVLRAIADSQNVFTQEFNQGFVAFQYYGYLRRIPDAGGYNGWLTYMNAHPNDFRTMVHGFMDSDEYRRRFGPNP